MTKWSEPPEPDLPFIPALREETKEDCELRTKRREDAEATNRRLREERRDTRIDNIFAAGSCSRFQ